MKRLGRRVATGLLVLVLAWFSRNAGDWTVAITALRNASLRLALIAGLATLVCVMIKGIRWWLFLRRSTRLSLGHAVRLTLAGSCLNSVLAEVRAGIGP